MLCGFAENMTGCGFLFSCSHNDLFHGLRIPTEPPFQARVGVWVVQSLEALFQGYESSSLLPSYTV